MKSIVSLMVVVTGCLLALLPLSAADRQAFPSVDRAAIARAYPIHFIENIFWPSEAEVSAKRVATELVGKDIDQLEFFLARALKRGYLPGRETIDKGVIALEGFRDGNDYLLLRYQRGDYDFQIEFTKGLYILVTPRKLEEKAPEEVGDYVKSTAFSVLNLPAKDDEGNELAVHMGIGDIGGSRFGELLYGYPPPKHWYSGMAWWSDGRNVLFATSGSTHEDFTHGQPPARDPYAPFIFEYRKPAAEQKAKQ